MSDMAIDTVRQFALHSMNRQATAKALGIPVSTLESRLAIVHRQTRCNPCKFFELVQLILAIDGEEALLYSDDFYEEALQ